jgi:hypothetical protein
VNVTLEKVLDEAPELAGTITRNAAQWRKTNAVIFDAFAIAALHDPGSIPGIVEAGSRGEKIFRVGLPDVPGFGGFVEIVAESESEIARRGRLYESSRRVLGGRADPWAAAQLVGIRTWRVLERTLHTGIKWLEAQRGLLFRIRRGDPRSFAVFKGSPVPITEEIFAELLENSKEFRAALGRDVREIERPGTKT